MTRKRLNFIIEELEELSRHEDCCATYDSDYQTVILELLPFCKKLVKIQQQIVSRKNSENSSGLACKIKNYYVDIL